MPQTQSRSLHAGDDDDVYFPDDASFGASVESDHQHQLGADMQMVNGVCHAGASGYTQTTLPIVAHGSSNAHVVVASRHHVPDDTVVVPAQCVSPFAASSLQARSGSFASVSDK